MDNMEGALNDRQCAMANQMRKVASLSSRVYDENIIQYAGYLLGSGFLPRARGWIAIKLNDDDIQLGLAWAYHWVIKSQAEEQKDQITKWFNAYSVHRVCDVYWSSVMPDFDISRERQVSLALLRWMIYSIAFPQQVDSAMGMTIKDIVNRLSELNYDPLLILPDVARNDGVLYRAFFDGQVATVVRHIHGK